MKKFLVLALFLILSSAFAIAQDSRPVKILEKPPGVLYGEYGLNDSQGTIVLKVKFLASGEIGEVNLITNSYNKDISNSAIEAARKIKFEPAKKDGVSVTAVKIIEYIYGWRYEWKDFVFAKAVKPSLILDDKAEAVLQKAVAKLGGDKYLTVKTLVGRGFYTKMGENASGVPSSFVDYIVYPDKERTEFKSFGDKTIQTNTGEIGWIFDGAARTITDQTPAEVSNFKQSIRTSLDNLLRGGWRAEKGAKLEYVGRREASLGKRNEVIKLTYADGFAIEFEFDARDATPMKSIYKRKSPEDEIITEEDRFAQFVAVGGVFTPYIIDHYVNGKQLSRVNYSTVEINTAVADALFAKPKDAKKVK